jgi:hypothetical protein
VSPSGRLPNKPMKLPIRPQGHRCRIEASTWRPARSLSAKAFDNHPAVVVAICVLAATWQRLLTAIPVRGAVQLLAMLKSAAAIALAQTCR